MAHPVEPRPGDPAATDPLRMRGTGLGRRVVLRGALASGIAIAAGESAFGRLAAATAVAPPPEVAGTAVWGAVPPAAAIRILDHRPTYVLVHHTASLGTANYSADHLYGFARMTQQDHLNRGLIDSGHQFMIGRGGQIVEGRHHSWEVLREGTRHVQGEHVGGNNAIAIGIENVGTYTDEAPTYDNYASLVRLIAYICRQYELPTTAIRGHRDLNATGCPGDVLYGLLPRLRSDVETYSAGGAVGRPPAGSSWTSLAAGARAERVRTVQYLLRHAGQSIQADGDFGPATDAGVRSYQAAHDLEPDGIVGPLTWNALAVAVRPGAVGDDVRAVQSQLNTKGERLHVDGGFGLRTSVALRQFQADVGVEADSICGPKTWIKLAGRPSA